MKKTIDTVEEVNKTVIDRQIRQMLDSQLSGISDLSTNLSHEINNPLTVIKSYIPRIRKGLVIALEGEGLSKADKMLEKMDYSVNRISSLLSVILEVSMYDRDQSGIGKSIQTSQIFKNIKLINKGCLSSKDIAFNVINSIPQDKVNGELSKLIQIVNIIISNAVDALKDTDRPKILVTVKSIKDDVVISIMNNGSKLTLDEKTKIFNPFYTTKDVGQGIGMGLTIVKMILRDYEGSVEVVDDGDNTCFIVRVPKALE